MNRDEVKYVTDKVLKEFIPTKVSLFICSKSLDNIFYTKEQIEAINDFVQYLGKGVLND